jgi:hypothetical protein
LVNLSTFRSISLAIGALLACWWLNAAQGLVSGLAIGFLAEVTRAYLTKTSISGELRRGESASTPATSGAPEGAVTGARIGF